MTNVKDTTDRFITAFNAHDERALLALHAAHIKFDAPGFKATNSSDATAYATRWLKGSQTPFSCYTILNLGAIHVR